MFALLNKRLKNNGLVMGISKSKLNCNARVLKVLRRKLLEAAL